ncbi:MAG: isochorismatase family cysteine hydrolase [Gammaproteobacteria bacterium]|jgi:nicotinamidase-related amidase|nr:cysteine hydrolase [Gammaproteobacteria bacterium]MDP6150985.1 isochorismatase family cysteine hydrolase [Gammaproteobacteria bacterium]MDP7296398.1 isochorismatase family cysteine hydrolase [Gammaproteobacteria bacterium]MDP7419580.1 isochorismatase family cysteine hydrolase [Gammaproteobacteria bacterium]HJP39734.1 isochorismatase family cysteine hydrolase [Gammaproteobacteria bacterium]
MKALLCLDFENDIVHPDGKVSGKGYAAYQAEHGTLAIVRKVQDQFRAAGLPVIHVRVGFSPGYAQQPKGSPLMGQAHKFGAFDLSNWGGAFIDEVAPQGEELVITKHRVGSFYGTALDLTLKTMGVDEVFLAGVATDMVVESTAREAHDRDFAVRVIADCCIAANVEDQQRSLTNMKKIASIVTSGQWDSVE